MIISKTIANDRLYLLITASPSHPKWKEIKQAALTDDTKTLMAILSVPEGKYIQELLDRQKRPSIDTPMPGTCYPGNPECDALGHTHTPSPELQQVIQTVSRANEIAQHTKGKYPKNSTEGILANLFDEFLGIYPKMTDTTTSLGMDSLDHVEACMMVEEEFGFEIPDAEAEKLADKTFADWVVYIKNKTVKSVSPIFEDEADEDAAYLQGMEVGVSDRAKEIPAKYLPGDDRGSDTPAHARYIKGYIAGYA